MDSFCICSTFLSEWLPAVLPHKVPWAFAFPMILKISFRAPDRCPLHHIKFPAVLLFRWNMKKGAGRFRHIKGSDSENEKKFRDSSE
jgi:hypothetical protein